MTSSRNLSEGPKIQEREGHIIQLTQSRNNQRLMSSLKGCVAKSENLRPR